jgi:hypothetical protein
MKGSPTVSTRTQPGSLTTSRMVAPLTCMTAPNPLAATEPMLGARSVASWVAAGALRARKMETFSPGMGSPRQSNAWKVRVCPGLGTAVTTTSIISARPHSRSFGPPRATAVSISEARCRGRGTLTGRR